MTDRIENARDRRRHSRSARVLTSVALVAACSCSSAPPPHRTFDTPEAAVRALNDAAKAANLDDLLAIFGPDGKELFDSSDPAAARSNREVFTVAVAEGWHVVDEGSGAKTLIIGKESWPFPVPIVKAETGWRFDTEAGKEEVLARRIGRNELAAIKISRAYVAAQREYARAGHDGKPAGLYARTFRSEAGRQNGLYWPALKGQPRSPLGDMVAEAAEEGRAVGDDRQGRVPFHGYYFKILTAQGGHASDGARDYVTGGQMSQGFALVAWPADYDVTGIMTFIVSQAGVLYQKDLGQATAATARTMLLYNPDNTWSVVE